MGTTTRAPLVKAKSDAEVPAQTETGPLLVKMKSDAAVPAQTATHPAQPVLSTLAAVFASAFVFVAVAAVSVSRQRSRYGLVNLEAELVAESGQVPRLLWDTQSLRQQEAPVE